MFEIIKKEFRTTNDLNKYVNENSLEKEDIVNIETVLRNNNHPTLGSKSIKVFVLWHFVEGGRVNSFV